VAHSSLAEDAVDRTTTLENIPELDRAEDVATFHPDAMWATLDDIDGMVTSLSYTDVRPRSLPEMNNDPVTSIVPPLPMTVYAL
jgi:hypothetical protein